MAGFLTNSGLAKLAVATPLTPMTVKYMAFDGGQGTPKPTMTSLFNEVYRTEIPNPTKDTDAPTNLVFSGFVPTTVGGWTVYGVGLFDSSDVLVAYLQLAESVVKSAPDSALKMSWQQDFIISLANADQTNLIVTDSVQFRHDALTNRNHPDAHDIASITGLQTELDKDKNNVKITGDQIIKGVKEFLDKITVTAIGLVNSSINFSDGVISLLTNTGRNTAGIVVNANSADVTFTGKMIGDASGLTKARSGVAGVVIPGQNINIDTSGIISVRNASNTSLGVVIGGSNVNISNGYVNVNTGSKTTIGALSVGDNIDVSGGRISSPIATSSSYGVLKLANSLTVKDANTALSSEMGKKLSDQDFGVGQVPQDVTSSRAIGASYKNTDDKPYQVSVTLLATGRNRFMQLKMNGVIMGAANNTEQHDKSSTITTMVPVGATIVVTGAFDNWSEIR